MLFRSKISSGITGRSILEGCDASHLSSFSKLWDCSNPNAQADAFSGSSFDPSF